jgi:hypothetical protein
MVSGAIGWVCACAALKTPALPISARPSSGASSGRKMRLEDTRDSMKFGDLPSFVRLGAKVANHSHSGSMSL